MNLVHKTGLDQSLLPAQQAAYEGLKHVIENRFVGVLHGGTGSGKSFLLHRLCREAGGRLIRSQDVLLALQTKHPLAIEETFYQLVIEALQSQQPVFLDELSLLLPLLQEGCGSYPRSGLILLVFESLLQQAEKLRVPLIFCGGYSILRNQSYPFGISDFTVHDYSQLCHHYLGDSAKHLDFEKIFRFAPRLDAHQLRASCLWLRDEADLSTERFIDYLKTQYLTSNVQLAEVQAMDLHDLLGVDDVIRSLEANIILPLENDVLAKQFDLKPKRGVLLAGPPGTGKTSVGRALAHRLKSKFFLIDGTMIAGTSQFYGQLHYLFEQAKENAPSILFIDDSDVIFESGEELGLYRYLLTMLDGLESASAARVCVILTAMDISHIPPALIRSGRIELWLEMKLPNQEARRAILQSFDRKVQLLAEAEALEEVASATEGFTGADLKRLVEDAKILLASDLAAQRPRRSSVAYFLEAAATVRNNKIKYEEADQRARAQRPRRNAIFSKDIPF